MPTSEQSEIAILETSNQDDLSACSLVLSAVDIHHTVSTSDSYAIISVAEEDQERARYHLAAYRTENENWPPERIVAEEPSTSSPFPALIVIGALSLFYHVTGPWSSHSEWFINGAGNSSAILYQGEYYRIITSLTLHADITHLLGNCFLGGFLLHFFCKNVGPGLGIFAVLLSAAMGNYINVQLHGAEHYFVGFSTAVFAMIGMLSMVSYHANKKLSKLQLIAPLMAGAALLAMTGSSGERTDLGAHLFGLLSGFLLGRVLITEFLRKLRHSLSLQFFLFLFTLLLVCLNWNAAMRNVQ